MPTIFRTGPYRFYFFASDCEELRHIHVDREAKSAKFWLDPAISLAENKGFARHELRDIEHIIEECVEDMRDEWDAFCGGSGPA